MDIFAKSNNNEQNLDINKKFSLDKGENELKEDPLDLLNEIYENGSFDLNYQYDVSYVTKVLPYDIQNNTFPESLVLGELAKVKIVKPEITSSYGGCGPIAMMGIIEYFARSMPNYHIASNEQYDVNGNLIENKEEIAYRAFYYTKTDELDSSNTICFPGWYVSGFSDVMESYNCENNIYAINYGTLNNENDLLPVIKENIEKGLPVTMYNAFSNVAGLGNHYVNIIGYQDYTVNYEGEQFEKTLLKIRNNWAHKPVNEHSPYLEKIYYVDSAFLNHIFTGIICYDINYNTKKVVFGSSVYTPWDTLINDVINEEISLGVNFTVDSYRLRCLQQNTLKGQYLILSSPDESDLIEYEANGIEEDDCLSYIHYDLSNEDRLDAIDVKLAKLNNTDIFNIDDQIVFEVKNSNGDWDRIREIDLFTLQSLTELDTIINNDNSLYNDVLSDIRIYMPAYDFDEIRIGLKTNINDNEQSKNVVISSLYLHFDNKNNPTTKHIHGDYVAYSYIDASNVYSHIAYCSCGETIEEPHIPTIVDGSTICEQCGYVIEQHNHEYTLKQNDNNTHIYECLCGKIIEENHVLANPPVGHTTQDCTICGDEIIINHVYGYHYDTTTEHTHKTYCICNDNKIEDHIYSEIHYENTNIHIEHCICGAFKEVEHVYSNLYQKHNNSLHKSYCICGAVTYQPHAISPSDVGLRFANCMFCNALINLRDDFVEVPGIQNIDTLNITENGSYKINLGIIVLVDEDIEKYLKNELIFKKEEDNLDYI